MLRSRFQSLPRAFNARLIPVEKTDGGKRWSLRNLTGKNENVSSFSFICDFIAIPQTNTCSNKCQFEIVIFNYFVNFLFINTRF